MLKFLLLVVVVGVAVWMLTAKGRSNDRAKTGTPKAAPRRPPAGPQAMVACAHCGVHLPQPDTVADAAGRPYCSESHRLAGPR